MLDYEEGRKNLKALISWYEGKEGNRNEAATRLHLIDRLIFECLGWERCEVFPEDNYQKEYTDYTFKVPRSILVIEAKKENQYFELPAGQKGRLEYNIKNLCRDYLDLKAAIEQAAGYCQARGISNAAVTNGHQFVVFLGARLDSIPPLEGKAIVFPSLEFIYENFLIFWQLLSKAGILDGHITKILTGAIKPDPPPKIASKILNYPVPIEKTEQQLDLDILSDIIFDDVSRERDLEETFYRECYSSSSILSQYSAMSKKMIEERYTKIFDDGTKSPTLIPVKSITKQKKNKLHPELLTKNTQRPIILLGDVGVGKSSFIHNLIHVEAASVFENAIVLYLDFGTEGTLTSDIKQYILKKIKAKLLDAYDINIDEDEFIRQLYKEDLERFSVGANKRLLEVAPDKYYENEVKHLLDLTSDLDQHLKNALIFIEKVHQKQIIVFLDNADQREDPDQQSFFIIGCEIAANWPATIFIPLQPETFYRSVTKGSLSSYHPKVFTIHPPRIEVVIEKRLKFALKLTSGEIPLSTLSGGSLSSSNIESVIKTFYYSFQTNDALKTFLENISGGNVRIALNLIKNFFGSSNTNTEELLRIIQHHGIYNIQQYQFLKAVIHGDDLYYDPQRSVIANIFDVGLHASNEHFLIPSIILTLHKAKNKSAGGFVDTAFVYEQLQSIGYQVEQIDLAIIKAMNKKLIQGSTRRTLKAGDELPPGLRATSIGVYTVSSLAGDFVYLEAMSVDTPISVSHYSDKLLPYFSPGKEKITLAEKLEKVKIFREYLDKQWALFNPSEKIFDWREYSLILANNCHSIEIRLTKRS